MGFVKKPNLPDNKISHVIIGEKYTEIIRPALEERGIKIISCPLNTIVDERVAAHADLSVLHLGGKRIVVSQAVADGRFVSELNELGAEALLCEEPFAREYPEDCSLCAVFVGDRIFHNKYISVLASDPRTIHVKQGYAKCSVCVVSESAVITSDEGLAKAMITQGLDVLTISQGFITLDGYNTGFIGGSAFKISREILALTGTLDEHPDRDAILGFLNFHGVEPLFLTDIPIFDIGCAIPLKEYDGNNNVF